MLKHSLILMAAAHDAARAAWRAHFEARQAPRAEGGKLTVKAAAGGDTTELMLYDDVGFWGVSSKQFNDALAGITTPKISLRINSPGGDVFEGYAMYNALKAHRAEVHVTVDGLAASIASVIAMAGDTITMADPSMMMIHRAWTVAGGNAVDMQAVVNVLAKVDGQIADVYAARAGKPAKDMMAFMDAETWFTAEEALAAGLVTAVTDPDGDGDDDTGESVDTDSDAKAHAARVRAAKLITLGVR